MRKNLLLFIIMILVNSAFAQNPVKVGQLQFNAGVGFSSYGIPLYVGLDYGVHKDITVGGTLSYRSYSHTENGVRYNHSLFGIIANGNYHFNSLLNISSNWDVYAGLNLGFYFWNSPDNYHGNHNSEAGFGLQIGGRYYFNDKIGLNLELGGGYVSGGRFGISIKL